MDLSSPLNSPAPGVDLLEVEWALAGHIRMDRLDVPELTEAIRQARLRGVGATLFATRYEVDQLTVDAAVRRLERAGVAA